MLFVLSWVNCRLFVCFAAEAKRERKGTGWNYVDYFRFTVLELAAQACLLYYT
jgi:hypothetical protein